MPDLEGARGRERRYQKRYTIHKPVSLTWRERRYAGRLRDISLGGAAVRVGAAIDPGADVVLALGDLGTFEAVVLRRNEDDVIAAGFKLDVTQVAQLGRKLATIFHGAPAADDVTEDRPSKHPLVP